MLCIENNNTDPYVNHALEEWLTTQVDEDCFMLWRNDKSILLGRNQNIYHELNLPYIKEHNIKIVRRITGGGAVFTDEGNLMYTYISGNGKRAFGQFRLFAEPVLSALRALGIPATFTGRNDMVIHGRKFSGNAQCICNGKLLHHGTLMYNADTGEMAKVLTVSPLKLHGKGVASMASRVTNIKAHLPETANLAVYANSNANINVNSNANSNANSNVNSNANIKNSTDIECFRAYLLHYIMNNAPNTHGTQSNPQLFRLSADEWDAVRRLAAHKYASPTWIYGRNPVFTISKETKFTGGILQVYGHVVKGRLANIRLCGDFFGNEDIGSMEALLTGVPYEAEAVKARLAGLPIENYIAFITLDELVNALLC